MCCASALLSHERLGQCAGGESINPLHCRAYAAEGGGRGAPEVEMVIEQPLWDRAAELVVVETPDT